MANYGDVDRNRKIVEFVETYDWSYQLVADKFGVTRNVVAGVIFRDRHPYSTRVNSPNSIGANKTGAGYRAAEYFPSVNAWNSVVERETA